MKEKIMIVESNRPSGGEIPGSARCEATARSGEPCRKAPLPGERFCVMHHPDREEERKRLSSKGGRATMGARSPLAEEIRELKAELRALANGVREGEVAPPVGAVINQIYNSVLRAVAEERKARELDELEGRIEALEGRGS